MSNPNTIQTHGQGGNQIINAGDVNYIQKDIMLGVSSPNKHLPYPNSPTICLSARKGSFDINKLGNTEQIYSSIFYDDIIALCQYFADWGFSYTWEEGANIIFKVIIPIDTLGQTDFTESLFTAEQWEIVPKEITVDLNNTALMFNGLLYYLPTPWKIAVENALKNNQPVVTLPSNTANNASLQQYSAQANLYLQFKKLGIKGTYGFTQILKRTACIDINNTQGQFETQADILYRDNVEEFGIPNYIYSSSDMVNKYAIPYAISNQMLPSYQKLLSTSVDTFSISAYAGWLVKAPIAQGITQNKLVYQQEFEWSEWTQYLYTVFDLNTNVFPIVNTNNGNNPIPL